MGTAALLPPAPRLHSNPRQLGDRVPAGCQGAYRGHTVRSLLLLQHYPCKPLPQVFVLDFSSRNALVAADSRVSAAAAERCPPKRCAESCTRHLAGQDLLPPSSGAALAAFL